MRLRREMRGELAKLFGVQIGDSPVIHLTAGPMDEIVTSARQRRRLENTIRRSRNDEQINWMFVPFINERDHGLAVEIIQSSPDQRESVSSEIANFRSEIDFAIEPRLYRVLI